MKRPLLTIVQDPLRRLLLGGVVAALLAACGGGSGDNGPDAQALRVKVTPPQADVLTLQLLHVADMDSGGDLVTNSKGVSALIRKFRSEYPNNTLFVSSGDNYIPGPFFNAADDASLNPELGTAGAGRADIEILNLMGVQASAVGNHDLDLGTNFFAGLVNSSGAWRGAQFPYLSANLNFRSDPNLAALAAATNDGAEAATLKNRLATSTVATVGGKPVGIVGATTPTLASITSTGGIGIRPANPTDVDALAAEIQPAVDALLARGIDKIVLLAHMQQLDVEKQLATRLRGVDVIVAGGSNTGLYDADDRIRPGDTRGGTYPLRYTSPTGDPVLVVNVDADYKYLGRLVLRFDGEGRIVPGQLRPELNGAWATDAEGLARAGLTLADAIPGVAAIADKVGAIIAAKDGNLFGASRVYLEGDRVFVRGQETNLGHLSAEANLLYAQALEPAAAISLKNGGGIRSSLGAVDAPPGSSTGVKGPTKPNPSVGKLAGDISQLDIEFSLRFNNGLSLLSVNREELKALLEHGVGNWTPTSTQGRFPQVAGLRFSFDPAGAPGARVRTIVVEDPDGAGPVTGPQLVYANGSFQVPAGTAWRLVTLDFLAGGGDLYPFNVLSAPMRVDLVAPGTTKVFTTPGGEQWALANHLQVRFPRGAPYAEADRAAARDERIQNLSLRTDSLIAP